jgi:RHS repeat-associated protein
MEVNLTPFLQRQRLFGVGQRERDMTGAIGAMPTMDRLLATIRLATSRTAFASLLALAAWLLLGLNAHAGNTVTKVTLVMTDLQGNVLMTKDTQGHILARYTYRPYGTQQSGPTNKGPGYTGHVNDPGTGLVYMQQRYYDPAVGRFISPDPVGPTSGNVFNFGRYTYANDNPVVNTDPTGASCMIEHKAPCDSDEPPPDQPPPAPKPTTLPTVTVTAGAVAIGAPIDWGGIGLEAIFIGSIPTTVLVTGGVAALLYPTKMGAAPCEMPGGPPCGLGTVYNADMPGDKGAEEWGRRHGVDKDEARRRFHDVKQGDTAHKGGKQDWTVNPDTGDIKDPDGEVHGTLGADS